MGDLIHDLRYAARVLVKSPGFTLVAVLTLALGIGANTVIFSVVDSVLLKPLALPAAEQVVAVWQTAPASGFPRFGISEGQFDVLKAETQSLGKVAAYHTLVNTLTGVDDPSPILMAQVTSDMLAVLGLQPVIGRTFLPEENLPQRNNVVLISHGMWQQRFGGDSGVLGRTIQLGGTPMTIIGVLPLRAELPEDLSSAEKIHLWQAEVLDPANPNRWGSHYLSCLARLKPGVSAQQAHAEVDTILARLRMERPESDIKDPQHAVFVRPLPYDLTANSRRPLGILLGAVGLLLLIASANVANLLLARGATREKELAIRAAIGAGRGRLVTQLLGEAVLLAMAGGALGCLLAWWGLDVLTALRPGNLPRLDEIRLDARVLFFALGLSGLTSFLFGVVPALQLTQVDLNRSLRQESGGASPGRSRHFVQRMLVGGEVALAVVLVLGAALLGRSLYSLLSIDPGFRVENLLTMRVGLPSSRYAEGKQAEAYFSQLLQRVRALPGVVAASNVNAMPLTGFGGDTVFDIEGRPSARELMKSGATGGVMVQHLGMRIAGADYFQTLGIRLLEGRAFDERDHAGSNLVVVINQTMAKRFWPDRSSLGQRIRLYRNPSETGPWMEIIGVMADTKISSLNEEAKQEIVMPFAQQPGRGTSLVIRASGETDKLAASVREEARALEREAVLTPPRTMKQVLNSTVAQPRLNLGLLGAFSGLALLMAVIGVYGVMSYSVSQRTREFGIRMALGARRADVMRLVMRQGLAITLAGLGVGLLASLALTRLMQGLLFGISATDPLSFAAVAVLLALVALLAIYVPARRATKVDPLVALRYE